MRAIAPVLAVLALFLALRLPVLTADPPDALVTNYHDCASAIFDEGWWTANARDRARFGEAGAGGFDLMWISPVFTALVSAAFAVGGVGLAIARLVAVLGGALGVALLLRMDEGTTAARTRRWAGLLLAVSFVGGQLGRLALPETVGTAAGLAGVWLLLRGGAVRLGLAGTCAALAVLTKPHFAFLLPALLAGAVVLAVRHRRPALPAFAAVAAGMAWPLAVWGGVLLANREEAARLFEFYDMGRWVARNPEELGGLVAGIKPWIQSAVVGIVYRHPLLVHAGGLFVLSALAAPRVAPALLRPRDRSGVPDSVLVFGLWIVFHGALLAPLPFQPLRYFLPGLPALAWLTAWFLVGPGPAAEPLPLTTGARRVRALLRWGAAALVAAQLAFAGLRVVFEPRLVALATAGDLDPLHPEPFGLTGFLLELARARSLDPFVPLHTQQASWAALVLLGVIACLLGAVAALGIVRWAGRVFDPAAWSRWRILPGLLVAAQLALWAAWLPARAHTIRDLGRDLDGRLPAGSVVSPGGTYALESRLQFDSSAVRAGRMFDAAAPTTHFLCLESHPALGRIEPGGVERAYPGTERLHGYLLTGGYAYGLYRTTR